MKIIFIGDIVGKGGRRAVASLLPQLKQEYGFDFCVANGENSAGGSGMTSRCVRELTSSGVQVITGGDHIWDQRDFVGEVKSFNNVIRPANVSAEQPGCGWKVFPTADGLSLAVICLLGRTFLNNQADCPFRAADQILAEIGDSTKRIIVDFHAEATSEKIALGRYLDGRVSAVLGTHTHVPTADEQIFPGGTAFQCDVGMVGSKESVLGRDITAVLHRFSTGMPARFSVNNKDVRLHAVLVEVDDAGRAVAIERIARDVE